MSSDDSKLTDPLISSGESYDEENAAAAELTSKKRKVMGDVDVATLTPSSDAAAMAPAATSEEEENGEEEETKSVATTNTAAKKDENQVNRLQSKIARLTAELERVRKGEHHRTSRPNHSSSLSSLAAGRTRTTAAAAADNSYPPSQETEEQNAPLTSAPHNNDNAAPSQLQPLETDPPLSYPNYRHPQQHPPQLRMWILATYRLLICHNQTAGAPSRHWTLKKLLAIGAAFLLSILSAHEVIEEANHHHHHPHSSSGDDHPYYPPPGPQPEPLPPAMSRADHVASCAARLSSSNTFFSDVTSSRLLAVEWFVIGPGRSFADIPQTSAECEDVNSSFASLYGLLVLRGALNITLPAWNTPPEGITFETIKDVCSRFDRITCDPNKTSIISLNLAKVQAPYNITGTIPPEIGLLHSLQKIELNNNMQLHGTIPSELGKLSSLEHLHLHSTALGGAIPSELGHLNKLNELFLEHNENLNGNMPANICALRKNKKGDDNQGGTLKDIHADCGGEKPRIECSPDCCTKCDL